MINILGMGICFSMGIVLGLSIGWIQGIWYSSKSQLSKSTKGLSVEKVREAIQDSAEWLRATGDEEGLVFTKVPIFNPEAVAKALCTAFDEGKLTEVINGT